MFIPAKASISRAQCSRPKGGNPVGAVHDLWPVRDWRGARQCGLLRIWHAHTMHILAILLISLFWLISGSPFSLFAAPTHDSYGADAVLGPMLEPCITEVAVPDAIIIDPDDPWEEWITNAQAGATVLFRAGTYQGQGKLWLPAGAPTQPITLKPYNCEAVTLYTSLRPLAYTLIAGLTLEAQGIADSDYVLRIDSEYKGEYWGTITQVTIRNNIIRGGDTDAIRISDDCTAITITGNHIDGGATGHNIFVTSEKLIQRPDQILITNNKLTKRFFTTAAEDMFQVRDIGYAAFTHNTCSDGLNMEQCIDIKTTTTPLLIANNFFDGEHLHQLGTGEDGADGCMVIHENDEVADQHIIEHNYFKQCKGAAIRFAAGGEANEISSGFVRYNLFLQTSYSHGAIALFKAQNLSFLNNTMICGRFKLGDSGQNTLPSNTTIKNNIFYKTKIEDKTTLPTYPYTCSYNLLFATLGNGFVTSGCTNTIGADPQFIGAKSQNFYLLPTSPALHAGEGGIDLGAFSLLQSSAEQSFQLYLPFIAQSPSVSSALVCDA